MRRSRSFPQMPARRFTMLTVITITATSLLALSIWASGSKPSIQNKSIQPWVTGEVATIHSKVLGEDRNIVVYNPDKYGVNRLPAYPVLFLLDENDVSMVIGMVRYLSAYSPRMSP